MTFTMIVVMLNFIIAVIGHAFSEVKSEQYYINYGYKAELNLETQELINFFSHDTDFKAILYTCSKNYSLNEDDPMGQMAQVIMKFLYHNNKQVKSKFKQLNKTI